MIAKRRQTNQARKKSARQIAAVQLAAAATTVLPCFLPLSDSFFKLWGTCAAFVSILIFICRFPIDRRTPNPIAAKFATAACFMPCLFASTVQKWVAAAGITLSALVVCSFAFQMFRKDRTFIIRSLSTMIMCGFCAVCAGGWCLLGNLRSYMIDVLIGQPAFIWLILLYAVSAAVLALASYLWTFPVESNESEKLNNSNNYANDYSDSYADKPSEVFPGSIDPSACLGMGIAPFMISGAVIAAELTAMLILNSAF